MEEHIYTIDAGSAMSFECFSETISMPMRMINTKWVGRQNRQLQSGIVGSKGTIEWVNVREVEMSNDEFDEEVAKGAE